MMSAGAPAATAASSTILAARLVHFLARGWGLKTMPFRVFREIRDLKMAVLVGLVVGTIPAMTPRGSATLIIPKASSVSMMPQVFMERYLLQMYSAA